MQNNHTTFFSIFAAKPTPLHPDTGDATIFIYDGFEGGIGISENLYTNIKPLWQTTLKLIENCECKEGSPIHGD
jgi:DEAD/DEAH box helicase domain-containing protein